MQPCLDPFNASSLKRRFLRLFSPAKLHFPLLTKQSSIKAAVNFLRGVYPAPAVPLRADGANQPLQPGLNFPSQDTVSPWRCPTLPALGLTPPLQPVLASAQVASRSAGRSHQAEKTTTEKKQCNPQTKPQAWGQLEK